MTREEAEQLLVHFRTNEVRDCVDASLLGQALAVTMSDADRAKVREIINNAGVVKPEQKRVLS